MNHVAVVDASVAVKWVLDEDYTDRARALLTNHARTPLVAPPLLHTEVANAIYQRTRRTDQLALPPDEAGEALAAFLQLPVQLVAPDDLYPRAVAFARAHGLRNIYDSVYVTLAQILSAELWTADRPLLAALGSAAPWVRFIGDYPLPHQP